MNKKSHKKIFLLFSFCLISLSFDFGRSKEGVEGFRNFSLLNDVVFQESYLFEIQLKENLVIAKMKEDNRVNSWFSLKDVAYFDLHERLNPERYLPNGISGDSLAGIEDLFATLSFANDKLWKEIVYLVEFGVTKEIIFFDVNSQDFYLRNSYSGKSKESLNLIVEGIESRLFFIESNRLHFFLDAVLLLPEDFKLNWFDTIYAWKPPELPN